MDLNKEFDRQVGHLLARGYPRAANISADDFRALVTPLKKKIGKILVKADMAKGRLPFVIVVPSDVVPTKKMMSLVRRESKAGFTKLFPRQPQDFTTTAVVPKSKAYLLVDIDRGKEYLNVPPDAALKTIKKKKRLPLTIDEGIALITHYPEFLKKNNCFSMLASRFAGDKRVPAIWINSAKRPNLGWCWDGNPHTWLGSASAKKRVTASNP